MGDVKGIRVDIETGSAWWSPTSDALFLGIYGAGGGREFRLNGAVEIGKPDQSLFLVLGDACCKTPDDIQVEYSLGLGDNDPLLNSIDLGSVEYVYIRKETAASTPVNDDVLSVRRITVLLCDSSGTLRRWRKIGKISFSDEVGLQHWLAPIAPPSCMITVTLKAIRHRKTDKHPAGRNWDFCFGAGTSLTPYNILNYQPHKVKSKDEWRWDVNASASFAVIGCCGKPREIVIFGQAREQDAVTFDDQSSKEAVQSAPCGVEPSTQSYELSMEVVGEGNNYRSEIVFEYDVTSVCLS